MFNAPIKWCPRPDLNQHALRQQILSLARLGTSN
jgi:hypothetical protein